MTNLVTLQLQQELIELCQLIGETTDLKNLRKQFIVANALWARIDRLAEPTNVA